MVKKGTMYAALAAYFWRVHWLPAAATPAVRATAGSAEHLAVLVPMALHAMLLYQSVFAGDGMHLGWKLQLGLFLVPTILYGIAFFGQDFPKSEASAKGLSVALIVYGLPATV